MNYTNEIRELLEVYPNTSVRAVKGTDYELNRPTITYIVEIGGIEVQFLTYDDTALSDEELADFLDSIESKVNTVA